MARKRKQIHSLSNLFGQWNDKIVTLNLKDQTFIYKDKNPKKPKTKQMDLPVILCLVVTTEDNRGSVLQRL